jgi:hypothetical protein
MSVLVEVFSGLEAMGLVQLLLGFVVCTGYAAACGRLLPKRGVATSVALAALAAAGFVAMTPDWTHGIVLLASAVAVIGVMAALAWLSGRILGIASLQLVADAETALPVDTDLATAAGSLPTSDHESSPGGHRSGSGGLPQPSH